MWLEVGFAALLRILLSKTNAKSWLDDRVEISTPVSAWKRVRFQSYASLLVEIFVPSH